MDNIASLDAVKPKFTSKASQNFAEWGKIHLDEDNSQFTEAEQDKLRAIKNNLQGWSEGKRINSWDKRFAAAEESIKDLYKNTANKKAAQEAVDQLFEGVFDKDKYYQKKQESNPSFKENITQLESINPESLDTFNTVLPEHIVLPATKQETYVPKPVDTSKRKEPRLSEESLDNRISALLFGVRTNNPEALESNPKSQIALLRKEINKYEPSEWQERRLKHLDRTEQILQTGIDSISQRFDENEEERLIGETNFKRNPSYEPTKVRKSKTNTYGSPVMKRNPKYDPDKLVKTKVTTEQTTVPRKKKTSFKKKLSIAAGLVLGGIATYFITNLSEQNTHTTNTQTEIRQTSTKKTLESEVERQKSKTAYDNAYNNQSQEEYTASTSNPFSSFNLNTNVFASSTIPQSNNNLENVIELENGKRLIERKADGNSIPISEEELTDYHRELIQYVNSIGRTPKRDSEGNYLISPDGESIETLDPTKENIQILPSIEEPSTISNTKKPAYEQPVESPEISETTEEKTERILAEMIESVKKRKNEPKSFYSKPVKTLEKEVTLGERMGFSYNERPSFRNKLSSEQREELIQKGIIKRTDDEKISYVTDMMFSDIQRYVNNGSNGSESTVFQESLVQNRIQGRHGFRNNFNLSIRLDNLYAIYVLSKERKTETSKLPFFVQENINEENIEPYIKEISLTFEQMFDQFESNGIDRERVKKRFMPEGEKSIVKYALAMSFSGREAHEFSQYLDATKDIFGKKNMLYAKSE